MLDNVALAVQAHAGHSFRFWRDARREPALREPARAALAASGSRARADVPVADLSHGEHRQLEIAMALATRPRMLLLDEPMAGMGPEESARMVAMLRELKGELTILLVEHDMDAVFALADRITRAGLRPRHRLRRAGRDPRQCRRARGLSRRAGAAAGDAAWLTRRCSNCRGVETSYGLSQVLFGVSLSVAPAKW